MTFAQQIQTIREQDGNGEIVWDAQSTEFTKGYNVGTRVACYDESEDFAEHDEDFLIERMYNQAVAKHAERSDEFKNGLLYGIVLFE